MTLGWSCSRSRDIATSLRERLAWRATTVKVDYCTHAHSVRAVVPSGCERASGSRRTTQCTRTQTTPVSGQSARDVTLQPHLPAASWCRFCMHTTRRITNASTAPTNPLARLACTTTAAAP
jgi:hypothetical protein